MRIEFVTSPWTISLLVPLFHSPISHLNLKMLSKKAYALKLIGETLTTVAILTVGGLMMSKYFRIEDDPMTTLMPLTSLSYLIFLVHPCLTFIRFVFRVSANGHSEEDYNRMHRWCLLCRWQKKHWLFEFVPFFVYCGMLIGCFVEQATKGPKKEGVMAMACMFVNAGSLFLPLLTSLCVFCFKVIVEEESETKSEGAQKTTSETEILNIKV